MYTIYRIQFIIWIDIYILCKVYLYTTKINVKTPICLSTSFGRGEVSVKIGIHTMHKPLLSTENKDESARGRRDTEEKQPHVYVTNGAQSERTELSCVV